MKMFVNACCVLAFALAIAAATAVAQNNDEGTANLGAVLSEHRAQLKDPDWRKRSAAADAIGNLGPRAEALVPDLMTLLDSTLPTDKMAAAIALSKMGEAGKPALPALRELAVNGDGRVKEIAQLAVNALDPPASATAMKVVWSVWFQTLVLSIGGGIAAFYLMARRRAAKQYRKEANTPADQRAREARAKEAKAKESKSKDTKPKEAPPAPAGAPVGTSGVVAPKRTPSGDLASPRKRMSRNLPGIESYLHEEVDSPEKVKRDLNAAQQALKLITDKQKEIAEYFEEEAITGDPERIRALKKDNDQFSLDHFRTQVRIKGLEVKMLVTFLNQGIGGDQSLRERSEATLVQRLEELKAYCENPMKIWCRDGQWVSSPSGPAIQITDMREHLMGFDIVLPDRPEGWIFESADTPALGEPPASPIAGEPPMEAIALDGPASPSTPESPSEPVTPIKAEPPIEEPDSPPE